MTTFTSEFYQPDLEPLYDIDLGFNLENKQTENQFDNIKNLINEKFRRMILSAEILYSCDKNNNNINNFLEDNFSEKITNKEQLIIIFNNNLTPQAREYFYVNHSNIILINKFKNKFKKYLEMKNNNKEFNDVILFFDTN